MATCNEMDDYTCYDFFIVVAVGDIFGLCLYAIFPEITLTI